MIRHKVTIALLLSAFFPYFLGGVRLEHFVFSCVFLIFCFISISRNETLSLPILGMAALLFSGVVFAVAGSGFLPDAGTVAPVLTMAVRLMMPAIVLAVFAVRPPNTADLLKSVAKGIVWIAVPLSLLALGSAFFDMSWLLDYYVKNEADSVWSQAFTLGRFTGIFNQPIEAGIFYSVALLALVYLASQRCWYPIGRNLILVVILIGGSLSLSKNFVVLGVLITLIYAVTVRVLSVLSGVVLLFVIVSAINAFLIFGNQDYANSFFDLYTEGGLLLALTAGRLGTGDTEVSQLWSRLVTSGDWLTGVGLGSYLPLDNGYLEYFYQGGVLALASYLLFIVSIFMFSIRHWSVDESKLLFAIGLFVAASSLGGPVVSASRANIPLLMLAASCILHLNANKKSS